MNKGPSERLHFVWFQLYDILEEEKLWQQQKVQCLPGVGGKEGVDKSSPEDLEPSAILVALSWWVQARVPSNFLCWNLIPKVTILGVGLWEVVRLWGQSPHELLLPPIRTQQEDITWGSSFSPDTKSAGAFVWLPSLQNCEKYMFIVCKPPSLWYCYISLNRLWHAKLKIC